LTAKKREYSRDFTPKTAKRHAITVDRIPAALYGQIKKKATREGVSLRALILRWLSEWVHT
jgi:hypothetical protein